MPAHSAPPELPAPATPAPPMPFALLKAARQAAFIVAALFCLSPRASPALSLALGMALALTIGNPFLRITRTAARWLLQACVVGLGFGMNLSVVLRAGMSGAALAAGSIAGTLALGFALGKLLRIGGKTSALISAGTAICGGSAIAAIGSVTGASEGEMTVAMGTVFLLNAVALFTFPAAGHALHLTQTQFGTWAGVAIHDISSVVGAASRYGLPALQTATAVKLSRALWIVPLSIAASALFRRRASVSAQAQGTLQIPWFIGLFVLASLARSAVPGVARAAPQIGHWATAGLTLTLFCIGAGISRATLKVVGWKPMAQGVLLWVAISGGSLLAVLRMVR